MKKLVLIDSNALTHRAFHAYPLSLKNSKGEHTNVIFGFFSMLLQIIDKLKPDYLACIFDAPGNTFRNAMYEGYKAQRPEMDIILAEQIEKLQTILKEGNIDVILKSGFEADDIIGTILSHSVTQSMERIVVTGDKDIFQLLNQNTQVYLASNPISTSKLFDQRAASEKMGFPIEHILTYKSLKGDPSDNIPGVKGIGDVTAIKLIQDYGILENIYANLSDINPRTAKLLEESKKMADLSRKLATIKCDVEGVDLDMNKISTQDIYYSKLAEQFEHHQLRSLYTKIQHLITTKEIVVENFITKKIDNKESLIAFVAKIESNITLVLHVEADKDIFNRNCMIYIAINNNIWTLDTNQFNHNDLQLLFQKLQLAHIIVYDAKNILHQLENIGISNFEYSDDLLLFDYVMNQGKILPLETSISANQQTSLFDPDPVLLKVQGIVKSINRINTSDNNSEKLNYLYRNIEILLQRMLVDMERRGISLDTSKIIELKNKVALRISAIEKEIFDLAGEEFNIASPKQLASILFDKLGIKGGKKTKSGTYSTNEEFLLDHKEIPIIQSILSYRELYKIMSTYINTLPLQINPKDNKIHTTYKQTVAVTGRLSSVDPNLQNIPQASEFAQELRAAFIPSEGHLFISFDYSQQELRLLAEFSGDKNLIEAFQSRFDIHSYTASKIFNIKMDEVDSNQRRIAKTVNFGVVYGISSFGLADRLKISNQEGQKFIDDFFHNYPSVKQYFEDLISKAKEDGYVETYFGRRKDTQNLFASAYQLRMGAQREVINFPLQGSAADNMKIAMLKVNQLVKDKYSDFAFVVLQVHDELLFEVKTIDKGSERLQEFVRDIKITMKDAVKYTVPMLVEAKIGNNWSELVKIS